MSTYTGVIVTPDCEDRAVVDRWNPWRELRRREHIEFLRARLPDQLGGGIYWPEKGWAVIVLDDRLLARDRAATLTHELIHDEQGGGCTHGDPVILLRHERAIDLEVARRLVDQEELLEFVTGRAELGEGVTARDVADWFDVSDWVATLALEQLRS